MQKFSEWISQHIALIILIVAAIALFLPNSFNWIPTAAIQPLLGIVMFGMGLTLKPQDFQVVFKRPKDIIIGSLAQFTIMPLIAVFLSWAFQLPTEIAIGVLLVGCCPGGTASNVYTYLSKGDVALSVGMTTVSTLLAPIVTPFLIYALAGENVDIPVWSMLGSILQVVILPIFLGFLINHYCSQWAEKMTPYLPMVSCITISLIVACIVAINSSKILACSLLLGVVVILHNLLGLALGYGLGSLLKIEKPKRTAIAIEVGMQNSGLATSLAATHFALFPMATIPGAIFSVWHNLSGSIACHIFKKINEASAPTEAAITAAEAPISKK